MNRTEKSAEIVILAGGDGTRMGGRKDALVVDGVPILRSHLLRLAWPGSTAVVIRDRISPVGGEDFGRVIRDDAGELRGPLAGIRAAARVARSEQLVLAIDMPNVSRAVLELLANAGASGDRVRMFRRGDGQIEPLPMWLSADAAELIEEYIAAGGRSLHGLAGRSGVSLIDAPAAWPADVWLNLNRPDDLPKGVRIDR